MSERKFELNPPGVERQYLAALNECFAGWGSAETFDSWYRTPSGAGGADLLVLRRGDRLVAGTAIVYRRLTTPAGETGKAGIISGAWTIAEERGTGCLLELLQRCRQVGSRRGAGVLLAFIAAERPSVRTTARLADEVVPSWYLVHPGGAEPEPPGEEVPLRDVHRALADAREGVSVSYPRAEDLGARLSGDRRYRFRAIGSRWLAVFSSTPNGRRLELITPRPGSSADAACAFGAISAGQGNGVRAFTTRGEWRDIAVAAGFTAYDGNVMLLAPSGGTGTEWLNRDWDLQEVDRA